MATIEQVREHCRGIADSEKLSKLVPGYAQVCQLCLALLDEHEAMKDEWPIPRSCTCEVCESRRRVERLIEEM